MTPRERMLKAFQFDHPDRLPVYYHPSTAGLHVHGQKLLDLFRAYPPDNAITFDALPQPPKDAFDADGRYHEFRADELGTVWEYRIFGVAGHPHRYALQSWRDPLAFPPVPKAGSREYEDACRHRAGLRERYLLFDGWGNLFERLHALRPFDEVLMGLADEDPDLLAFLDRLVAYRKEQLAFLAGTGTDVVVMGDDWGTQTGLLVSPGTFRSIFKPRIRAMIEQARAGGARVLYHTCGAVYPLYRDLVEAGINALWHQVGLYDTQAFAREAARDRVLLFLHMDRQHLVPRGTPREIREAVRRYAAIHRELGGGAIFYVEIENDAPFENVEALVKAVHEQ
jgi:uroporphyrinogen decarboxylase